MKLDGKDMERPAKEHGCLSGCVYCKAVSSRGEVTCSKPSCMYGASYPMRGLLEPRKACDDWKPPEERRGYAIPYRSEWQY